MPAVAVAVVVVVVAGTALIEDCAKADGATGKTNRREAATKTRQINLHMAQNHRNEPTTRRAGGALHPFRKILFKELQFDDKARKAVRNTGCTTHWCNEP
jgi:hypothetical protein